MIVVGAGRSAPSNLVGSTGIKARLALAPGETAALRRVQDPIRAGDELPINHLGVPAIL